MGCGSSKQVGPPALIEDWPLKAEATRIFHLADRDKDGKLSLTELEATLRTPSTTMATAAMTNMDVIDQDGMVSLGEWLAAQKLTFDKSEVACKTALKMTEKALESNLSKEGADGVGLRKKKEGTGDDLLRESIDWTAVDNLPGAIPENGVAPDGAAPNGAAPNGAAPAPAPNNWFGGWNSS